MSFFEVDKDYEPEVVLYDIWQKYLDSVVPEDTPEETKLDLKKSFYAGVCIGANLSNENKPSIEEELNEFAYNRVLERQT